MGYECVLPPCAISGIHSPPISGRFVASGSFFYIAYGLGMIQWDEEKEITVSELSHRGAEFCAFNISHAMNNSVSGPKDATNLCFAAQYAVAVLHYHGFQPDDRNITF